MPKVQNRAFLKLSRYDPFMISIFSTRPSNVSVVFIFFFPLNDHTCVRPVTYWMRKSNHARTRTSRSCRRQACVIIERDMGSPLESSCSFIVGCKEKGGAWIFGGRMETVSQSRYTHTSQCFPLMCTSAWILPCSPQLVQCQPLNYLSNGCLHLFKTCHQRQTPAEREPVHPKNMEFARHRYLRCLCILVQPLTLTWRN